jgi:phospholipid transport system substrate-binding protein
MKKTRLIILLSTWWSLSFASESMTVTSKSSVANNTESVAPLSKSNMTSSASVTSIAKPTKKVNKSNVSSQLDCVNDSPCFVIKDTSIKVLSAINKNLNERQTLQLITNVIETSFNFEIMTKFAMGQNWKLANDKEQTELVENFKNMLIFTYSSALSKFRGAQITLIKQSINDRKAMVYTQVTLPNDSQNNQPINVEYDLVKVNSSTNWQTYDIKIENASLVTTYRNQFNDIVARSSVGGLIKELKNRVTSLQRMETK